MATVQAHRAIKGLLAAGYERKEFRVRTSRSYAGRGVSGRPCYQYGDPKILVFAPLERQLALAEKVAEQGIGVLIFVDNGKEFYPLYTADAHKPCVERRDLNKRTTILEV